MTEDQYYKQDKKTFNLIDILNVLAEQVKFIIFTPIVVCILVIIYVTFLSSPVFKSDAKIMSSARGNKISNVSGLAAQFGISLPNTSSEFQWSYSSILSSRAIAKKMLKRKFDTKKFGDQKTLLEILNPKKAQTNFDFEKILMEGIDIFTPMIKIEEDLKTKIYTISMEAFEPLFVKNLVKALLEELDNHLSEFENNKIAETKMFIQNRIIETEKELNNAEEILKNFRDSNRRISNSPSLKLEEARLNREVTVLIGVFTTLKQQLEMTKIEEVKESDNVIIIDEPEVPLFRIRPAKKRAVISGAIIGIILGIVLAFIAEATGEYYKTNKKEIERIIKLLFFKIGILKVINKSKI